MPKKSYIYEHPLNERIRIFLRIEALLNKLDYFKKINTDIASYNALLAILEITALVERGDIKKEIIKELERQNKVLNALVTNQKVDKSRLELTLSKIKHGLNHMHTMDGKLGEHIKTIDFLLAIKQRAAIPGGSCNFDIPQLRFWLNLDAKSRQQDIDRWAYPYHQLLEELELLLNIIRDSAIAEKVVASNGFFQEALDTSLPNQMLRIQVQHDLNIYPEISAGKHRYTIRFLQPQESMDKLPVQLKQDIDFKLFRCTV